MDKDSIAVMVNLEIDQAHIIGASMGGMIAQTVAYDFPERTQSLAVSYTHLTLPTSDLV